jgi:outer membrane biogenesis lipoprotein LolB
MRLLTFLAALLIAACTSDNSRYQDNANLERPPEMPAPQSTELATDNELEQPIRRHGKGLKSDVYRNAIETEFR